MTMRKEIDVPGEDNVENEDVHINVDRDFNDGSKTTRKQMLMKKKATPINNQEQRKSKFVLRPHHLMGYSHPLQTSSPTAISPEISTFKSLGI